MSIEASPRIDEKGRMNVLLIICDQLRRDHLGYVGDPIVSTPNIDELAAQGTDFTRTYTCVPTCAPNRAHRSDRSRWDFSGTAQAWCSRWRAR